MKIVLDVSEKCESTSYPWWLILDPGKMWEGTVNGVAAMVTGPFFSRESAEAYLESHQYNYSDKAAVYCHSGHKSREYVKAFEETKSPEYVKAFEETKAGELTRIEADADMG